LVIALLRRHVAFNKLLKKSPVQQLGNTQIHIVAGYGPGSYNGRIFFPVSDINPLVLRHEQAHVQLNHHLDLWLLQCVRVIGWINPVVYYLGSQLILVHEYEADALAVNGNQMGYTQALLANVLGTRELTFTHAFFHHPIKNRILMLQRQTAGRTKMAAALLMLLMSGGIVVAQNVKPKVKAAKAHKVEKIYRQVEVMPEFKGDIGEWVRRQLEYPDAASEKGQEGRVIIEFVVARNGQIMRPKVVRQSGVPALDAEALRVVSLMPAWSPGKQNGVPVNTYFNLPFTFKLE
jgi:TonB family protein